MFGPFQKIFPHNIWLYIQFIIVNLIIIIITVYFIQVVLKYCIMLCKMQAYCILLLLDDDYYDLKYIKLHI